MKDIKSMKILRGTPLSPFMSFLLFMEKNEEWRRGLVPYGRAARRRLRANATKPALSINSVDEGSGTLATRKPTPVPSSCGPLPLLNEERN